LLRWLYFVSGLMLTGVIGAGLLLWTAKRRGRCTDLGFVLVERLNIGFVAGTPLAFAAFLLANRLLPPALPGRAAAEVRAVFVVWAVALLFASLRTPRRAWGELLAVTAAACLAIPVVDLIAVGGTMTGDRVAVDVATACLAVAYGLAAILATSGRRHARGGDNRLGPITR
jgi:hypothetical protein